MNLKLPETIWQAASLKEIGKMPTKRLVLLLLPSYMAAVGVLCAGLSIGWIALKKFGF